MSIAELERLVAEDKDVIHRYLSQFIRVEDLPDWIGERLIDGDYHPEEIAYMKNGC